MERVTNCIWLVSRVCRFVGDYELVWLRECIVLCVDVNVR